MKRVCKTCGDKLPFEKFPKSGYTTKDGKELRRWACHKCYYRDNTRKQAQKVQKWFEDYKKTLECGSCGLKDHRVLEFHHRDPETKSFNVSSKVCGGGSPKVLKEEIEKCDVLCACCHRIFHYEERRAVSSVG